MFRIDPFELRRYIVSTCLTVLAGFSSQIPWPVHISKTVPKIMKICFIIESPFLSPAGDIGTGRYERMAYFLTFRTYILYRTQTLSDVDRNPFSTFAGNYILNNIIMLAEWGKTTTQYELGLMYYKGLAVEQNYKEALKWFRVSAQKGLPDAQFYLGLMYYEGKAVARNYSNASYLFLAAAKQGQTEAQFFLGDGPRGTTKLPKGLCLDEHSLQKRL